MSGNDGWQWQRRQQHQWFGHGTKPKEAAALPALAERIAALPRTAIAGLPASARHHAAPRFEGERAAAFVRAMTDWVRGRALPDAAFAERFFDRGPDSPGVKPLHEAAKAVGDARGLADLRAAADHVAAAMREVGLDHFHAFIKDVVGRDVAGRDGAGRGPLVLPEIVVRPKPPVPGPGRPPSMGRAALFAAILVGVSRLLAWLLERHGRATPQEIEAAQERFGIGKGSGREAAAKALLEAEKANPGLVRRAMNGDEAAVRTVREITGAKEAPGEGIETYSDEERALVKEMIEAGHDNASIRAALAQRRAADPARTRRELMAARQANTPWIPREVLERIPMEWGLGEPNKKGKPGVGKDGWRWFDPQNKGNGVRIDKGNPLHGSPSQREDHVIVRRGPVIGRSGMPLPGTGAVKQNATEAHIPLREYRNWKKWGEK